MRRRGLLTWLAAGVVAPIAAGELIREGFVAALNGRGAEENWTARVADYGRDYMAVGAAALQARLAGDLVVIQQHLETPAMWASAARLPAVYGKTTGEPREAVDWYRLAAEAADRAEDNGVRVWVRGRAAIALAYEGAALPVAERFAAEALALAERPSIGRLNALVAGAHVAAGRGPTSWERSRPTRRRGGSSTGSPATTARSQTLRSRRGGWPPSAACSTRGSATFGEARRPRPRPTRRGHAS